MCGLDSSLNIVTTEVQNMMNYNSYSGSSAPAHAPDAYRLDIPKVAIDNLLAPSERHKWISEAAYFISERGGFAPGREL
jgi:hypothetical protein